MIEILSSYIERYIMPSPSGAPFIIVVTMMMSAFYYALLCVYNRKLVNASIAASVAWVFSYLLLCLMAWRDEVAVMRGPSWATLPAEAYSIPLYLALVFAAVAVYLQFVGSISRRLRDRKTSAPLISPDPNWD